MPIKKLDSSWWALRVGLGLAAVLAGVDKFFNLLTNWNMYLSPITERFLPVSGHTFMLITGPIEILVGLSILTRWTRIGAYVLSVWLLIDRPQPGHNRQLLRCCGPRRGDGDRGVRAGQFNRSPGFCRSFV